MSRVLINLLGAALEAWTELRIHRTRVLLSLIGVAVAVAAITSVVGLGQIAQQAQIEQMERGGGRPATLYVGAYRMDGLPNDLEAVNAAFAETVDRYQVDFASHTTYLSWRVQLPGAGVLDASGQAVDASFGTMHRISMLEGAWFAERDNDRLAPAIIINEWWWQQLGSPDLATHPTVELLGENNVTAVVVGVTPSSPYDTYPSMFLLYSAFERIAPPEVQALNPPQYEFWVPPELSEQITPLIQRDMTGALGGDYQVDVSRQDYGQMFGGDDDPLLVLKLMIAGGATLVLLLGALGLVNISLVTMRQRIREIGIRRSFGATAGRVFFAVMMESIVATFVAGVVGVIVAILLVQMPVVQDVVSQGVIDRPPFPLEAALLGIVSAVVVGAIAGLLPALVAVRVKVIDAIRF